MTINEMEIFLDVCEKGSFSNSAEQNYISTQGLSNIIKRMEEELQAPLFIRNPRGVQMTEYGVLFRDKAIQMVQEYHETVRGIHSLMTQNKGYIQLVSAFGILRHMTPEYILEFQNQYENYNLDYVEFPDLLVEEYVSTGKADIGITPNPDPELFDRIELFSSEVCFVAHDKSKFYKRESVRLKEIVEEPIVIESNNFKIHQLFMDACKENALEPNIFFNTSGFSLCYKICNKNEANTLTLDYIFDDMRYENIRMIPIEEKLNWKAYLITKKGTVLSQTIQNFISYTVAKSSTL